MTLSVLISINNPSFSKKLYHIIIEIQHNLQIRRQEEIKMLWKPIHSGLEGIEIADNVTIQSLSQFLRLRSNQVLSPSHM